MAQKRMIDKKISVSNQVDNLSLEAKLIFTWAIPHADDIGLLPFNLKTLKAILIPMWDSRIDSFESWIKDLLDQGLWEVFEYNNEKFYRIIKFGRHQTLKKDRQPQLYCNFELEKSPKKSWEKIEKEFGFHLEDEKDSLETEEKRSEEKRSEEKLKEDLLSPAGDGEWNFKLFLEGMDNHKRRDFQIMAAYWHFKGTEFTNKDQAWGEIKRLVRPAKELVPYEADKTIKTMRWLEKNADFKWSLETVRKYVNEDLSKIKPTK